MRIEHTDLIARIEKNERWSSGQHGQLEHNALAAEKNRTGELLGLYIKRLQVFMPYLDRDARRLAAKTIGNLNAQIIAQK
jgi:hypothetical protein